MLDYVTPKVWLTTNWKTSLPTAVYVGAITFGVFLRNILQKGEKWTVLISNTNKVPMAVKVVLWLPLIYIVTPYTDISLLGM